MKSWSRFKSSIVLLMVMMFGMCLPPGATRGNAATQAALPSKSVHLTIVVTAGDENKPVDSASVYVKFVEERKVIKDKKIEMNLKTNLSGVCHVPEIPAGKILIQIIAPGWKTFGQYYDVDQAEQTINIALVRPPKWY